nr:hypothetical protein [Candidatus Sigynarchaeota archaeon]
MPENYADVFAGLLKQNPHVDKGVVLNPEGTVLFVVGNWDPSSDAKNLLKIWREHGPRLEIQGTGYSVLRSEPEQLVSTNLAKKGSVVGSITKSRNFLVA